MSDPVSFKRCVDSISALIDEAEFVVGGEGLSLKATDPSQISMVDFFLPKSAFAHFEAVPQMRLGIDLNYFSQVMSRAKAADSLELSVDESSSKMFVVFTGKSKRKFEVPLVDINAAELPNPKIDFDVEMSVRAEFLQEGLKDASLISTHIALEVDSNSFFMSASSSKGSLKNEVKSSDTESVPQFRAKKEARSVFPLDYLSDIVRGAVSGSDVALKLKSNAPAEISYKIGDAFLRYFLAPRIESE